MTRRGHGWQYYVDEINGICSKGEFLINAGIMFWADRAKKRVVTVVAHRGLEVEWEYRSMNDNGNGVLCNYCKERRQSVS